MGGAGPARGAVTTFSKLFNSLSRIAGVGGAGPARGAVTTCSKLFNSQAALQVWEGQALLEVLPLPALSCLTF